MAAGRVSGEMEAITVGVQTLLALAQLVAIAIALPWMLATMRTQVGELVNRLERLDRSLEHLAEQLGGLDRRLSHVEGRTGLRPS